MITHQVSRNDGPTRRRSLCGRVTVKIAFDPALDPAVDEVTGLPYGAGTSNPAHTTCRECKRVAGGKVVFP